MSKWKEIESYMDSKSVNESKFNITRKQAQMILDLKSDELKKMRFLAMLDIDKDEVKKLGKIDPSIVKAIGKQGGSFRTAMVRKRANEEVKEDAPTNSNAAGGVDMNPTGLAKKKELDARTKEYKIHARKLMAQRERRKINAKKSLCGSFRKGVEESLNSFSREEFIEEDNMDMLRDIVKRKSAQGIKLGDGKKVTVDMQTANAILQAIEKVKPATKPKMMTIVNKGNSRQFLQLAKLVFGK